MSSAWRRGRRALAAVTSGRGASRLQAVRDSRSLVRTLFLASAAELGVLESLRTGRTAEEIRARLGATRPERLLAWLEVGVALGELRRRGHRYSLRGRRARAIAADPLLGAHYRSVVEYQCGPYQALARLVTADAEGTEGGRTGLDDLGVHAQTIAEVSLAAAPFVAPLLRDVVAERRPARVLDVGCGTGVYVRAMLESDPAVRVDGIDLAPAVIEDARRRLLATAVGSRAELAVGDARTWRPPTGTRYGLVTLINNLYYFTAEERVVLFGRLASMTEPGGGLVAVSMVTPGSVASAHLHFMLVSQAAPAALPRAGEMEAELAASGWRVRRSERIVPTEPFVAVHADRPTDAPGAVSGSAPPR